jgi:hypothetical protein
MEACSRQKSTRYKQKRGGSEMKECISSALHA